MGADLYYEGEYNRRERQKKAVAKVKQLEAEIEELKEQIAKAKFHIAHRGYVCEDLTVDEAISMYLAEIERKQIDNPEWDATDAAHPAWWRGQEWGVEVLCQKINEILDGGGIAGVSNEPWESTRRRIAQLVEKELLNDNE